MKPADQHPSAALPLLGSEWSDVDLKCLLISIYPAALPLLDSEWSEVNLK